jgi:hypothetical protein
LIAGPLFVAVILAQAFTRPGFDITRHAPSLLSEGGSGWIQITNFELCGLLFVAFSVGMWRALSRDQGGTWGPLLLGLFGVSALISAGIFVPDPANGFPPGAPIGTPSLHGGLHTLSFVVGFIGLIAACFVFARRFANFGQRRWMAYSGAVGVVCAVGFALLSTGTSVGYVGIYITLLVVLGTWVPLMAARTLAIWHL